MTEQQREPDIEPEIIWPDPRPDPDREPNDSHRGPLDNDDDARFLDRDDPRRLDVERRRGRPFADEPEDES